MTARHDFISRLRALQRAVGVPSTINLPAFEKAQNEAARMLRNGLAIVAFSTIEDFLRARSEELLATLTGAPLPFDDLPNDLRQATTEGVVAGLLFQVRLMRRNAEDPVSLIQRTGRALSSTASSAYELSPLGIGRARGRISTRKTSV